MQDDKVFEQLTELSDIQMDAARKLSIRDELRERMAAEQPRRGWVKRLRSLAPVGVGAAAVVLAGAAITGIVSLNDGSPLTQEAIKTTVQRTAGSVAAGPSGNAFATNNTWFFVTMGILVAAMVVVFFTRRRAVRRVWVQEIVDVLRAPILWGLLLGIVVGVRGIPVPVPLYGSTWIWQQPSDFFVVSVTGLGAIGFLVGAAIQFGKRKVVSGQVAFWGLALPAMALLIGMVTFYRGQALTEQTLWSLASNGLEHVDGVGLSLPGHTSPADWRSYGAQLIQAGDDLGAVSQYSGRYGIHGSLYAAASALDTAGYVLVTSGDPQQLKEAEGFTRQAAAIVRKVAVATHGNVNSQNIPWLVEEIVKVAPSAYQDGAMPN